MIIFSFFRAVKIFLCRCLIGHVFAVTSNHIYEQFISSDILRKCKYLLINSSITMKSEGNPRHTPAPPPLTTTTTQPAQYPALRSSISRTVGFPRNATPFALADGRPSGRCTPPAAGGGRPRHLLGSSQRLIDTPQIATRRGRPATAPGGGGGAGQAVCPLYQHLHEANLSQAR